MPAQTPPSRPRHRIVFIAVATLLLIPIVIVAIGAYGIAFSAAYFATGGLLWLAIWFAAAMIAIDLLLAGLRRRSTGADAAAAQAPDPQANRVRPRRAAWPRVLAVFTLLFGAGCALMWTGGMQADAVELSGMWLGAGANRVFLSALRIGNPSARTAAVWQLQAHARPGDAQAVAELTAWMQSNTQRGGNAELSNSEAMKALARIGPAAAPAADAVLDSDQGNDSLEFSASEALESMGPSAAPALAAALDSHNEERRRLAAKVLGHIGPQASIAARDLPAKLAAAVDDANAPWSVVEAAADALPRVNAPASLAVRAIIRCQQRRGVSMSMNVPLAAYGPDAVAPVMDLFSSNDFDSHFIAESAIEQLMLLDSQRAAKTVPALIEALKRPQARARESAADVLSHYGAAAASAADALTAALKDNDQAVRTAAARALGAIGPAAKSALAALMSAMNDSQQSNAYRIECASSVAAIDPGNSSAAGVLCEMARHGQGDDPAAAAKKLARLQPSPAIVAALSQVIAAATSTASEAAASQPDQMGGQANFAQADSGESAALAAAATLGTYGPGAQAAVPALLKWAATAKGNVLACATSALLQIAPQSPQTIDAALRTLRDRGDDARYQTIDALGAAAGSLKLDAAGGQKQRAALEQAMEKAIGGFHAWTALNAISSYAKLDAPAATAMYVKLLSATPADLQKDDVVYCIGQLGPAGATAAPALRAGIEHHTLDSYKAGEALWKVSGDFSGLIAALNGGADESMASDFLGNLGPRAAPAAAASVDRPIHALVIGIAAAYGVCLLALFFWWRQTRRSRRV